MLELGRALPRLRRTVAHDLRQPDLGKQTVLACIVRILATCFLRPGSEEYVDANGSFGLATLRREHVAVRGSVVRFEFKGKAGKLQQREIRDARVARIVARSLFRVPRSARVELRLDYPAALRESTARAARERCAGSAGASGSCMKESAMRFNEGRKWPRRTMLMGLPLVFLACSAVPPPPGPVDIVREIVDPNYDYRDNPNTWGGDAREARHRHRDGWSSGCREGELTCSHEGATVCCSPRDRCCAGQTGPFCCSDRDYDR